MLLRFALILTALHFVTRCAANDTPATRQWLSMLPIAPLVLGIMWARLEFRPQLFTTICLAAELYLIISIHTGHRSWRWLWLLPPLHTLWINLHGGWIQGLAMLTCFAATRFVMDLLRSKGHNHTGLRSARGDKTKPDTMSHLPIRHLAIVLVVCILALCINPYGMRLITFPFTMQASWIRTGRSEWASPWLNDDWSYVGGGSYVPLLAQLLFAIYTLLAALSLASLVMTILFNRDNYSLREIDLVPIALIAFWLAFSNWHLRAVADAALMTSPFIAARLRRQTQTRHNHNRTWIGIIGLMVLTSIAIKIEWQTHDWQWTRGEPHCIESSLRDSLRDMISPTVHVFGTPQLTNWLLYRFTDRVRVHYMWDYVAGHGHTVELKDVWMGHTNVGPYLDRYHVDIIVLRTGAFRNVPVLTSMGWHLVHLDDRYFIMVPLRGDTEALIAREAYQFIVPWDNTPVTIGNAGRVLAESERALRNCPDHATFAWAYKAEALRLLGRYQESFDAHLNIPEKLVIE
jgi:hypothetical protein